MKEKISGFTWSFGVRTFRVLRRANLSTHLEPMLWRLARLIPPTTTDVAATVAGGPTIWMPAGYRDTRSVVEGLFQRDETRLFQRLTKPGMTMLDVGAYVGYFSLICSKLVGPSGQVFAFEPEPMAYEYLLRNIQSNSIRNIIPVNKAVSDKMAAETLIRDPLGPESFVGHGGTSGDHVAVESITLDSFLESRDWPNVDLIKMNIEGGELLALRGMVELSRRNPHLQLVMEFNVPAMARAAVHPADLSGTLTRLGFHQSQIVERELETIGLGELLPRRSGVYNLLLTK